MTKKEKEVFMETAKDIEFWLAYYEEIYFNGSDEALQENARARVDYYAVMRGLMTELKNDMGIVKSEKDREEFREAVNVYADKGISAARRDMSQRKTA